MQAILTFLSEIFSQPAFLMGIIAFVGLVALRPGNKLSPVPKPILGYLMLSAGATCVNLNPLGGIIEAGFNIRGVIPNNEAISRRPEGTGRGNHEYIAVRFYF